VSAGIPLRRTIVERNKVKNVKLNTNPVTTPNGLDFPILCPPIVELSMIGRIGRIQGDSIVAIPAKKEKMISNSIVFLTIDNSNFHKFRNYPIMHSY
jgi:hypothetical protein